MTPALSVLFLRGSAAPAVVAHPATAGFDSLRRVAFAALLVLCLGLAAGGLARKRPVQPRVWALLLGGQLMLGAADLAILLGHAHDSERRTPGVVDALRLLAYLLLSVGLGRLAGGRHPSRESGALLDATLVGTAAATVAGVFLILPASDGPGTDLQRAVAMACPAAGVLALAVLTRLVTGRGERTPAFHLLSASVVATVLAGAGSLAADRAAADLPAAVPVLLQSLALAGYILFAVAAVHPSMRTLSEPSAKGGGERLTAARLGALGGAMLLTPATLLIEDATGGARHSTLVAVGSTGVIVLVLVRIRGLLRQVEIQAAQLSRMARADSLTGLPNRRSWDFELARAAAKARGTGEHLVIALLDLDHFKAFNDSRGHQAGDELLRCAAASWRAAIGRAGTLARYGGEEFAVAVVGGGVPDAVALLERMALVNPAGQTFSAGVAVWDFLEDPADAVARADAALYAAKRAGRNRVVAAATPLPIG